MNKRAEHMRWVNEVRLWTTVAMVGLLDELETGDESEGWDFEEWKIDNVDMLTGQLNSYRAQKIAQFLGKTISKQKLLKYVKPKDYEYEINNKDIDKWLNENAEGLHEYWVFKRNLYTDNLKVNSNK